MDLVSIFNHWCQRNQVNPEFTTISEGPQHCLKFKTEVRINGVNTNVGYGEGTTKKASENMARIDFIRKLEHDSKIYIKESPEKQDESPKAAGCEYNTSSLLPVVTQEHDHATMPGVFDSASPFACVYDGNQIDVFGSINAKSFVNNWCQKNNIHVPLFEFTVSGPPHLRTFTCKLTIKTMANSVYQKCVGKGSSKKEAAEDAAKHFIQILKTNGLQRDEIPNINGASSIYDKRFVRFNELQGISNSDGVPQKNVLGVNVTLNTNHSGPHKNQTAKGVMYISDPKPNHSYVSRERSQSHYCSDPEKIQADKGASSVSDLRSVRFNELQGKSNSVGVPQKNVLGVNITLNTNQSGPHKNQTAKAVPSVSDPNPICSFVSRGTSLSDVNRQKDDKGRSQSYNYSGPKKTQAAKGDSSVSDLRSTRYNELQGISNSDDVPQKNVLGVNVTLNTNHSGPHKKQTAKGASSVSDLRSVRFNELQGKSNSDGVPQKNVLGVNITLNTNHSGPHKNQTAKKERYVSLGSSEKFWSNSPKALRNSTDESVLEHGMRRLDLSVDTYGNWEITMAKSRLHQFMQEHKIHSDYTVNTHTSVNSSYFRADLKFTVRRVGISFSAIGFGKTKMDAVKSCALEMVKQLYQSNLIEPFTGTLKKTKLNVTDLPPYNVKVPPELTAELNNICSELNLEPVKPDLDSNVPVDLTDLPQVEFIDSPVNDQVVPEWSTSNPNWNPWTSAPIEEKIRESVYTGEYNKILKEENSKRVEMKTKDARNDWLPIALKRDEIIDCVHKNSVVVIEGPAGCGKTTQVCQFILDDCIQSLVGADCNIIVSEPRRVCAKLFAEYVARERFEEIGETVGYCVRFDKKLPRPNGSILFCTAGSLIRRLEKGLHSVSHIIVDQVHERKLSTDYLLIILRDMLAYYPDMKIILLCVTFNGELFSKYFNNCPVVTIQGHCFEIQEYFLEDIIEETKFVLSDKPLKKKSKKGKRNQNSLTKEAQEYRRSIGLELDVDYQYDDDDDDDDESGNYLQNENDSNDEDDNLNKVLRTPGNYSPETINTMALISEERICIQLIEKIIVHYRQSLFGGSILIFLPSWNIIYAVMKYLSRSQYLDKSAYRIIPLHSHVPSGEQRNVYEKVPQGVTKIILATNIGESSMIMNDIKCVIDTCKTTISSSHNNLSYKFRTIWASKTCLEQRKGTAGRMMMGYCFYLCSMARYESLETFILPEMFRVPLYEVALSIKLLNLGKISDVLGRAVQPPPIDSIIDAEETLREMKCLDKNYMLTSLGRILATLPVDPRLGRMIMFSLLFGCNEDVIKVAAFASTQKDLFFSEQPLSYKQRNMAKHRFSDHITMLRAISEWELLGVQYEANLRFCHTFGIQVDTLIETKLIVDQLTEILADKEFPCSTLMRKQTRNSKDSDLDTVTAILCKGFYPNICCCWNERKVLLADGQLGLMMKKSVNFRKKQKHVLSPFFIYGESTQARIVNCRQLTMVSPIHLLLFGCKKVEYTKGLVRLDNWINLEMDPEVAAKIVSLRPSIEYLMMKVTMNPKELTQFSKVHKKLLSLVKQLCKMYFEKHYDSNIDDYFQFEQE